MRERPSPADQGLMRAFASGDGSAGERLYERYSSRIYGLGLVMLGNEAAAEDLVQDSFVKLLRSAERYDPARGSLDTWVLLVARSLALDALRRRVLDAGVLQASRPAGGARRAPAPPGLRRVPRRARVARRGPRDLRPGRPPERAAPRAPRPRPDGARGRARGRGHGRPRRSPPAPPQGRGPRPRGGG